MTIEFHCPHCEKLLKTADDKAGVRAKCPGCGEVVTVPAPQLEAASFDASFDDAFSGATGGDVPPSIPSAPIPSVPIIGAPIPGAPSTGELPAEMPAEMPARPDEMRPCPMCGESIRAASTRCRYCGEDLAGAPEAEGLPTQIEAGEILSRSWAIFQKEMGMSIAIVLIAGVLNVLAQVAPNVPSYLIQFGAVKRDAIFIVLVAQMVLALMATIFQIYVTLGTSIAMLKIARGETAQIGDLFAGGPYFWRCVGAGIVFSCLYFVGLLCCLVGAVVVWLLFGYFRYVLVDRDVGAIESLSISYAITKTNFAALLLIWLASIGLLILGLVTCGLGLLIVGPFLALVEAVTYLSMSGLRTAEQRRPA